MARIGIMTFLYNDNYGSILQAWALQQVLRELGHDPEHIAYRPSKAEKLRNLLASGNSPLLVLEGMRKRRVRSYGATNALHEQFLQERLATSSPCPDHAALARAAEAYDLLIAGSDQVWSPVWLNPAYFLDFTPKPCLSYAASLGVQEPPSPAKARRIAELVAPFAAVSVREEEGAALLQSMAGVAPAVMPDPVFLQTRQQWQALAKPHPGNMPYLLCYFLGNRPDYWKKVEERSQSLQIPALVIPKTEAAYQAGHALAENTSPEAWLGLLDGAAHIITDSFHGAAFACLLNRPFTLMRRYRENDPENKNSRVDQLLRVLALADTENPDWDDVNLRLAQERSRGREWLRSAIEQAL